MLKDREMIDDIKYIIYRIFETKWKRKIFDNAITELQQVTPIETLLINNMPLPAFMKSQVHFNKANELMDMIM